MSEVYLKNNNYKCKSCGGTLRFDPISQNLKCDKCQNTQLLPHNKTFARHPVDKQPVQDQQYNAWVNDNKVFKCANCGANVIINKYEISNTCPYCANNLAIQTDILPGLKPDGIIPFAFDKHQANEKFVKNVKRKFYVSGAFKRQLPESKICGTYIPSFVYDMQTSSKYDGVLYDTTQYEGKKTYSYKTINGTLNKKYCDVMIESSSKITQTQLKEILPYDSAKAIDFNNGFIVGYTVEHYADTLATCERVARETIDRLIRKDILSKYTYDGVDKLEIKTAYLSKDFNYLLVPIYKFEYQYRNKPYTTYMNGQNGKIDDNLPKSIPKIILTFLLILLIIMIPIILALTNPN